LSLIFKLFLDKTKKETQLLLFIVDIGVVVDDIDKVVFAI
jgi:hypothetical protein